MKIIWTYTAKGTFAQILEYLLENWTTKELDKFTKEVRNIIGQIEANPYMFESSSKNNSVRKGLVNNLVSLFYRVQPQKKEIELLLFWNNRQNPKKLKY